MMTEANSSSVALELEELASILEGVWRLLCSFLLVGLQIGFAVVETGCIQDRNVVATLMKHLLVLMVGAVSWFLLGSTIACGSFSQVSAGDGEQAATLLELLLCLVAVTIALRGVAERSRIWAHIALALAVPIVFYPVALRWARPGGWLAELNPPFHCGVHGGPLHLVGGVTAIVGAKLAGPRKETPPVDQSRPETPRRRSRRLGLDRSQYRAPAVVLGTLVVWVGWYGFVGDSSSGMRRKAHALQAARAAVNTTLGAVSGGLMALVLRATGLRFSLGRRPQVMSARDAAREAAGRGHLKSLDFVVCCFGAVSGLVAVSPGSDCMENSVAAIVGSLGSLCAYVGAKALRSVGVDDPMEAGAVHGVAGAVGVVSTGLFHRTDGLLVAGKWHLLSSQLLGLLAIGSCTSAMAWVVFMGLRYLGVLGTQKPKHRQELTLEAMQELVQIMDRSNLSLSDTLEALTKLRGVIYRPFSPQAGNHKIQGEVLDVCNLLNFDVRPEDEYVAFISHYKAEGGDAARIIYDHITQVVLKRLGPPSTAHSASHDASPRQLAGQALQKQPSRDQGQSSASGRSSHHNFFGVLPGVQFSLPRRGDSGAFLSTGSESRSIPLDRVRSDGHLPTRRSPALDRSDASSLLTKVRERHADDPTLTHQGTESSYLLGLRKVATNSSSVAGSRLDTDRLLFLDSCELRDNLAKDLDDLLNAVRRSSNFILLLTQGVLTRPWVLAELSVAVAEQKNIVAVRVEWPQKDDEKHFEFPDCIEGVSQQLETCIALEIDRQKTTGVTESFRHMAKRVSTRRRPSGGPSLVSRNSHVSSTLSWNGGHAGSVAYSLRGHSARPSPESSAMRLRRDSNSSVGESQVGVATPASASPMTIGEKLDQKLQGEGCTSSGEESLDGSEEGDHNYPDIQERRISNTSIQGRDQEHAHRASTASAAVDAARRSAREQRECSHSYSLPNPRLRRDSSSSIEGIGQQRKATSFSATQQMHRKSNGSIEGIGQTRRGSRGSSTSAQERGRSLPDAQTRRESHCSIEGTGQKELEPESQCSTTNGQEQAFELA